MPRATRETKWLLAQGDQFTRPPLLVRDRFPSPLPVRKRSFLPERYASLAIRNDRFPTSSHTPYRKPCGRGMAILADTMRQRMTTRGRKLTPDCQTLLLNEQTNWRPGVYTCK